MDLLVLIVKNKKEEEEEEEEEEGETRGSDSRYGADYTSLARPPQHFQKSKGYKHFYL